MPFVFLSFRYFLLCNTVNDTNGADALIFHTVFRAYNAVRVQKNAGKACLVCRIMAPCFQCRFVGDSLHSDGSFCIFSIGKMYNDLKKGRVKCSVSSAFADRISTFNIGFNGSDDDCVHLRRIPGHRQLP